MMKYKLPELPLSPYLYCEWASEKEKKTRTMYSDEQMRQYAETAVAPLLAEIERLKEWEAAYWELLQDAEHEQNH